LTISHWALNLTYSEKNYRQRGYQGAYRARQNSRQREENKTTENVYVQRQKESQKEQEKRIYREIWTETELEKRLAARERKIKMYKQKKTKYEKKNKLREKENITGRVISKNVKIGFTRLMETSIKIEAAWCNTIPLSVYPRNTKNISGLFQSKFC